MENITEKTQSAQSLSNEEGQKLKSEILAYAKTHNIVPATVERGEFWENCKITIPWDDWDRKREIAKILKGVDFIPEDLPEVCCIWRTNVEDEYLLKQNKIPYVIDRVYSDKKNYKIEALKGNQFILLGAIEELKVKLNVPALNIESIPDDVRKRLEAIPEGKTFLWHVKKYIANKNRIELCTQNLCDGINIKFLKDMRNDILLEEAPTLPCLIRIMEDEEQKIFIPKGVVGALIGSGGIGKTHWLTQLALAVTTGSYFLGQYPVASPGHVCLVLGENSDEDIWRLVYKSFSALVSKENKNNSAKIVKDRLATLSVTGKNAAFIAANGEELPFYTEFLATLKSMEPAEGWSLIILDPISRFMGSEAEKDNSVATAFISLIEKITLELRGKPAIIFGHHKSKIGGSNNDIGQAAARGSSAITDGVRFQINLDTVRRDDQYIDDEIKMCMVKSNHTKKYAPAILKKGKHGSLSFDCIDDTSQNPKTPSRKKSKNLEIDSDHYAKIADGGAGE